MEERELNRRGFLDREQYESALDALVHPVHVPGGLGACPDEGEFAHAKDIDYTADRVFTAIEGMPAGVDLSVGRVFSPVFDQGTRSTCLASAVVSLMEYYHRMTASPAPPLSREFFHYRLMLPKVDAYRKFLEAPQKDEAFNRYYQDNYDSKLSQESNLRKSMASWREMYYSGSSIRRAYDVLKSEGICPEELQPYVAVPHPDTGEHLLDINPPEDLAALMAQPSWLAYSVKREESLQMLTGNSVDSYRRALSGWSDDPLLSFTPMPVVFGLTLFQSCQSEYVLRTGWLSCPLPHGDEVFGGHALLAVGYRDTDLAPGGGYVIARNSWGEHFAWAYPAHHGYVRIPYAYIAHYAFPSTFTIRDDFSDVELEEDREWAPYMQVAKQDMRDSRGGMTIPCDAAILVDRNGLAELDTLENRRRFKENNYKWEVNSRMEERL